MYEPWDRRQKSQTTSGWERSKKVVHVGRLDATTEEKHSIIIINPDKLWRDYTPPLHRIICVCSYGDGPEWNNKMKWIKLRVNQ